MAFSLLDIILALIGIDLSSEKSKKYRFCMLSAEIKKNVPPKVYWSMAGIKNPPDFADICKNIVPIKYYIPPNPANKSTQNPVASLLMLARQGLPS